MTCDTVGANENIAARHLLISFENLQKYLIKLATLRKDFVWVFEKIFSTRVARQVIFFFHLKLL